jgi:predicted DsbA family dithiol-disulfide isomerase
VRSEPGVEIVWRAFELRPEPVPTLDPQGEYLQTAWSNSVYPLAERLGVTTRLPPLQPRSRLAHEAAHWARSEGRFDDYHAEVFRAFFERGEDIGDVGVLTSLATGLGLSDASLRLALETHEFAESVFADEREAEALGVSGVPAFVANRMAALSGVQSMENLKRLIAHVRARN